MIKEWFARRNYPKINGELKAANAELNEAALIMQEAAKKLTERIKARKDQEHGSDRRETQDRRHLGHELGIIK